MRARALLAALGAFTLVNGAITFYLVRTMYNTERLPTVADIDGRHLKAVLTETASRDARPPPPNMLASSQTSQHPRQNTSPAPALHQKNPLMMPRRWRLRCSSYKGKADQRSAIGRSECYGDRGTPYVQKALSGYFEMTTGDDWDLLWTLVPQTRYRLATHRPELFCPECGRASGPLRLWCDDRDQSIMFFSGAGDKCQLAEYLAAVNDAHPLHSFIGGTQLLRLPNDRAEFREAMLASGITRWIFKPCSGGGGDGQGIVTADDLTALPEVGSGVAQPYVMNPYLYQGVKFHLRLYVLVTSYEPMRALLFKDGLLKRAGGKYEEVEDDVLTKMQREGGDGADELRKAHWTNQHVNKDTPPLPLSKFFAAVDADTGDHGLGSTAREVWRQLRSDLSKIMCARVSLDMPDSVTTPQWSHARYGNCFDILGVDVMFDHGESGDSAHPRPRLMEINVGPDLTAHSGWDDELRIHSRMMLEVAGLLASRMDPTPGLAEVQRAMRQHVRAEQSESINSDEAQDLWHLMLEREHLRSFHRLLPPWQPTQRAGGSELDEAERLKDENLAQELSRMCLGHSLTEGNDAKLILDSMEAKLWRAAELLRAPDSD